MNNTQIIRPTPLQKMLGVSATTLWRLENTDPDFPKKIRFSARCVGFRLSDVEAYLEKKLGGLQ